MKKIIIATLTIMISFASIGFSIVKSINVTFPDVKTSDWFYTDVMNMVNWGVIKGNNDGSFAPARNVNRAELSAMWNRYDSHIERKLAVLETLIKLEDCANLVWDYEPTPEAPDQAVEWINKCIHMNAYFDSTKKIIEESNYAFWPSEVYMPSDPSEESKFDFKSPNYR